MSSNGDKLRKDDKNQPIQCAGCSCFIWESSDSCRIGGREFHAHSCRESFCISRITELENTNRLLCRDLDEAQRSIEVLRGESIE